MPRSLKIHENPFSKSDGLLNRMKLVDLVRTDLRGFYSPYSQSAKHDIRISGELHILQHQDQDMEGLKSSFSHQDL